MNCERCISIKGRISPAALTKTKTDPVYGSWSTLCQACADTYPPEYIVEYFQTDGCQPTFGLIPVQEVSFPQVSPDLWKTEDPGK